MPLPSGLKATQYSKLMIKKICLAVLVGSLATSCVSKKVYTELENKYAALKKTNSKLSDELDALQKAKNQLELEKKKCDDDYAKTTAQLAQKEQELAGVQSQLQTLQNSYAALERQSNTELQSNMKKNRELLADLEAKEKALAAEQDRLNKLKQDLLASSSRLAELENLIAAKDQAMKKLKDTLSRALNSFEGKGLTVEQRDGKVYVSMENKLLFNTGSWQVGPEGRRAVTEVAKVLADNPDIAVLIEGHTDNQPYVGGNGPIADNWDLSTKRATAIVTIIRENKTVIPANLTAAGRSEFAPIADNATADGKAKNRRIEIILTPKLDEINRLLNDN